MELTHEMAGLFISIIGLLVVAAAWPVPRQVQNVYPLQRVEPFMIGLLMRMIGLTVFMLGLMTSLSAG